MENFRKVLLEKYTQTNQFGNTNGMELTKFEDNGIAYRLKIKQNHLATPTTAHGGIIAGYMDGILGLAALYVSSEDGNLVSTVEFKINFLSPVHLNDVLIGEGEVISKGKKIIITKGKIYKESTGQLIAIATGTFNAYPYEKSGMTF